MCDSDTSPYQPYITHDGGHDLAHPLPQDVNDGGHDYDDLAHPLPQMMVAMMKMI